MTQEEKDALVEKMAKALWDGAPWAGDRLPWNEIDEALASIGEPSPKPEYRMMASAALSIAEPIIRKKALEETAMLLHETRGNILLHCGEMSAQELRSVEAVLRWKQDTIRKLSETE